MFGPPPHLLLLPNTNQASQILIKFDVAYNATEMSDSEECDNLLDDIDVIHELTKWGGVGGGIKTKKINVSHRSYDKQRAQRPKNLTTVFKQVLQQVVKCL